MAVEGGVMDVRIDVRMRKVAGGLLSVQRCVRRVCVPASVPVHPTRRPLGGPACADAAVSLIMERISVPLLSWPGPCLVRCGCCLRACRAPRVGRLRSESDAAAGS